MRVLIHGSDPWYGSGMSIVSDKIARGLSKAGHDVHMFASQVTGPERPFPPQANDPEEQYTLHGDVTPGGAGAQMFSHKLRKLQPDLAITNRNWQSLDWMPSAMNDIYMNNVIKVPLLIYGPPVEAEEKPPMFKQSILDEHLNDVFMVPYTENRYESMLEWDVDRYLLPEDHPARWVPHGVDPNTFYPGCSHDHRADGAPGIKQSIGEDRFLALFVGENWRRKNIDVLLDGWKRFSDGVLERGGERPFLLLHTDPGGTRGDDPFYSGWNIVKTAISYGLNVATSVEEVDESCDVVCAKEYTGAYYPPEVIASMMDEADVYILPSSGEGFSMTTLEAMATGTPIVQTDVPTLRWLAGDASRYISTTGQHAINTGERMVNPSASSLAGHIDDLFSDPAERERMAQAGLDRSAQFPWSRMQEGIVDAAEWIVTERLQEV